MVTFYNQASLSYNGRISNSNIVTGELLDVLSATKTAVTDTYERDGNVTYIVSVVNSSTTAYNNVTISDDLGSYTFNTSTLVPLTYIEDSVLVYINGVLQATPTVTAGPPLVISGIRIPAGGNAIIVYEAQVNQYAPLDADSVITNEVTITDPTLTNPIIAEEEITASNDPSLTISKSISPTTVTENGEITYTFIIQNYGNTAVTAADNVILSDTFNPILSDITVTFNGTTWTQGTNYTYDTTTGAFVTLPGQITVPAATYSQDPDTGEWEIIPSISTLVITGTV